VMGHITTNNFLFELAILQLIYIFDKQNEKNQYLVVCKLRLVVRRT
jgi:hypothetical protein